MGGPSKVPLPEARAIRKLLQIVQRAARSPQGEGEAGLGLPHGIPHTS